MSSTAEDVRQRSAGDIDIDGVRAIFNDLVARGGKPLAQIAPETSVAYATLHAWSKGSYRGNNERVARQVNAWLTTREAQERARATMRTAPPFVMTKTASRIWEVCEFGQTMPDVVLISADAGVGKTTAVKAYAATASNVDARMYTKLARIRKYARQAGFVLSLDQAVMAHPMEGETRIALLLLRTREPISSPS